MTAGRGSRSQDGDEGFLGLQVKYEVIFFLVFFFSYTGAF